MGRTCRARRSAAHNKMMSGDIGPHVLIGHILSSGKLPANVLKCSSPF
jgi:hypothetical protein